MGDSLEKKIVAVNDFVRRQVSGSGKTFSPELTFEEIAIHASERFMKGKYISGYRDGVVIVEAGSSFIQYFKCPFVKINKNTKLKANWIYRREGEEPYIQIRALNGEPLSAGKVEFILYRHDVLAENNENSSNEEWELISIHALPKGIDFLPMGPVTMMRNQLDLKGGTSAYYESKEWAKAVYFWQKYAALESDKV